VRAFVCASLFDDVVLSYSFDPHYLGVCAVCALFVCVLAVPSLAPLSPCFPLQQSPFVLILCHFSFEDCHFALSLFLFG